MVGISLRRCLGFDAFGKGYVSSFVVNKKPEGKKQGMNEQQQRIAIAKACGWTDIYSSGVSGKRSVNGDLNGKRFYGTKGKLGYEREYVKLLNYLHSLNAMREAEKTLTSDQLTEFTRQLCKLFFPASCDIKTPHMSWAVLGILVTASASQHAEAFLRALGLWKDEQL